MQVVKECFERVRIIKGVNYGIITNEQIELLLERYQLTEEQQRHFFALLREHGIKPINDSEVPDKVKKQRLETCSNNEQVDENEETDSVPTVDERKRIREVKVQKIANEIKEDPKVFEQYKEELLILKEEILQQKNDGYKSAIKAITAAMLGVSRYRVRERLKRGWICGTYMSRVRERSERCVSYLFAEEELSDLIECCANNTELDARQTETMLLILYCAPHVLVHRSRGACLD